MPDFSMSDLYSLFGQGGGTPPNRLQKMDPPAPSPYNLYGYGDPPEPPPPGAPQPYGPPDPMDEAIPPHLRQFYGQEGNYGQPPEAPPEEPGMMQRGWDATKDAAGDAAGAVGKGAKGTMDALGNLGLGDHTPEALQGALQAAEDAFKKALEAGKGAADATGDFLGRQKDAFMELGHTEAMNKARAGADLPPWPKRNESDPYYGREYPHLKHPQPGQDFGPPGTGPDRGAEMAWPFYSEKAPREVFPLRNPSKKPNPRRDI
jgi:hypothetical protein